MIHAIRLLLEIIGALTLTSVLIVAAIFYVGWHLDITEGFDIYDGRDDR